MEVTKEQFKKMAKTMDGQWTGAVELNAEQSKLIREEAQAIRKFDPKLAEIRLKVAEGIDAVNDTLRAQGAHLAKVLEP